MHARTTSLRLFLAAFAIVGLEPLTEAVQAETNPALSSPDRFMWEIFVDINRPAGNGSNDVLWETWALANDLFGDPNTTPQWPTLEIPRRKLLETDLVQQQLFRFHLQRLLGGSLEPVSEFAGPGSEVRINKTFFDFVVQEKLWYVEGQEEAFDRGTPIDAPIESKEIKAVWKPVSEAQKSRYHWQPYNGQVYGLIAIHVITKDIPRWTWATWEHVDNPDLCEAHPCRDAFGRTSDGQVSDALKALFAEAGLGSQWQNYRLVGTQMNYSDLIGRPIVLGNSVIESGFVRESSCMTCHARSSIGPPIPGLSSANRLSVFPPEVGAPDPQWFLNSGTNPPTTKYLQLDFVWTFSRAKRRTVQ